jgi:hypothetical protein
MKRLIGYELNRQRNVGINECNKELQMQYIAVTYVQYELCTDDKVK